MSALLDINRNSVPADVHMLKTCDQALSLKKLLPMSEIVCAGGSPISHDLRRRTRRRKSRSAASHTPSRHPNQGRGGNWAATLATSQVGTKGEKWARTNFC